jgi:hypothetical protein
MQAREALRCASDFESLNGSRQRIRFQASNNSDDLRVGMMPQQVARGCNGRH